jgi:hypothetical protein
MTKVTTDQLIEKIRQIGVKLPVIDYQFNGYLSEVEVNEKRRDGSTKAVKVVKVHSNFRSACCCVIRTYAK